MRRSLPLFVLLGLGWWLRSLAAEPLPASAPGPADFSAAIAAAEPSIVHVATQLGGRSRDDAVGSGFVLGADGLLVTSRHVLQGAQTILVSVAGHAAVPARVVGHDDRVDVTVLRVALTGLVPLRTGSSGSLRVGQWVLACGSPYGLERSWSAGIVSGLHRRGVAADPRTYEDFVQTDAAANLGNSGGPLLDASGRAVGMVTQILTRAGGFQGISLATPIEAVMEAVERITRGPAAAAERPSLGVMVRETPQGLEVTRPAPGSPTEPSALLAGDLLLAVDGADARTVAALARALWGKRAGDPVTVRVARGSRTLDLRLVLR